MNTNFNLSKVSWFGVGGNADFFFKPKTADELKDFLKQNILPITIIGNGSNLLIRDGGINGVVLKLGSGFGKIISINDAEVEVGAGMLDKSFAMLIAEEELSGFEFLSTIPGNIGGGVKMNCGCFGGEIADLVYLIKGYDFKGNFVQLTKSDIKFSYRSTNLNDDIIITSVVLKGVKSTKSLILQKMEENHQKRVQTQPTTGKTCGSTFKNPINNKAWHLLLQSGAVNLKVGGARFSEKHSNFIINDGSATAKDIESLGEKAIKLVYEQFGIMLEWEIKKIGNYL